MPYPRLQLHSRLALAKPLGGRDPAVRNILAMTFGSGASAVDEGAGSDLRWTRKDGVEDADKSRVVFAPQTAAAVSIGELEG